MRYLSYIILILFFISCKYKAHVRYVEDGDSFYLDNGTEVRIAEADAPEWTKGHNQEFGDVATQFTRSYLEGKTVTLKNVATDKYHRKVCEVWVNGIWFNEAIVKAGLAWVYPQYGSRKLYLEELQAKKNKIGLWASNDFISPYQFRRKEHKH